jgi:formate dehydrogenase major subunit
LNDNPLMLAPDRAASDKLFAGLDFLAVIDSVPTDTSKLAHAVLPDAGYWAKEGTTTSADRRVLRLSQAHQPRGEAQQGWRILSELGVHLAGAFKSGEIRIHYTSAAEIMDEIAEVVPLYRNARYREIDSGAQQYIDGLGPKSAVHVTVQAAAASNGHDGAFTLSASRGLFTSYEAAATHSKDADRLHREDSLKMNPRDAAALGLASGDVVTVRNAQASFAAPVEITAAVQPKMLWIASYYDAGAPAALFAANSPVASVEVSRD